MKKVFTGVCQKLGAAFYAPSANLARTVMLFIGVGLISLAIANMAAAQPGQVPGGNILLQPEGGGFSQVIYVLFGWIEGPFGALIMVVSGLGAILSAAFGGYKAALACLIVAVGSFILRTVVTTFFPTAVTQDQQYVQN